jgi:hypothetical protein
MNIKQYRKRLEQQVAKRVKAVAKSRHAPARVGAKVSGRTSLKSRIAAVDALRFDGKDAARTIPTLIETLLNREEPTSLREAAFRALKTASFLGPVFAPHRAAFLKCLREVATDPDPELREDALETLAAEKVPSVKALLYEGLKDPAKALVAPAKAIQFLSYDGHAESAPLIRQILKSARDAATKEAAVNFLASDPGSASLLSRLLKDKSQPARIRSLSATGLRLLNPPGFERVARSIVADRKENDRLRATCLGALTYIQDFHKTRANPAFAKRIARLESSASSKTLRASAKRFLAKRDK